MDYVAQNQYGVFSIRDRATINEPKEIRFITPHYSTIFKIPDGDQVIVCFSDGKKKPYTCKYIDETHLLLGNSAYHICELAERMQSIGAHIVPYPEKRVVWSNINLDINDWKEDIYENYPELPRSEYEDKMVELNDEYFEDEKSNLNKSIDGDLIVIADLGLWNGRRTGYGIIENAKLSTCLKQMYDYAEWYVTRDGEFQSRQIHHDGTNYYTYRKIKEGIDEDTLYEFKEKMYDGVATQEDFDRVTEKLGKAVGEIYGWEFPTEQEKQRTSTRDAR